MYILGISCYYHDSAAALLKDGVLVAAAEEERFSRKKHDFGFPSHAIAFCLRKAGITGHDLDYVVFYEKPVVKFERILMTTLSTFPRSWGTFREAMITWLNDKLWVKNTIVDKIGISSGKVLFVDHHLSHAAGSFFCSPFKDAAIITVDGVGEWATTTIGVGKATWDNAEKNNINIFSEMLFPHSLGLLYSAFTAFLGFEVNEGEYKVMGMAPYGEPRYLDKVHKLVELKEDSSFRLNMDYFSYHYSTSKTFNRRFEELFGPPRKPEAEFFTTMTHPNLTGREAEVEKNQYYADVAASIQRVTEEALLNMANHAYAKTGLKKLCIGGGVGLNCVANGRILRETPFEEIYIQPASGDSGGAVGAALYVWNILLQKPRSFVMEHAFWGEEYNPEEIPQFFKDKGITYELFKDDEQLIDRVVDHIIAGKAIGWFQGRFEWGPRALGNRSILADPRREDMKGIVNEKIKFREPFRPFAPVVLEEAAQDYFEISEPARHFPARFMLITTRVKQEKVTVIPAVSHMGTARLQTVRKEWNPRYYRLVQRFGEATGVPVLLNTSFNLRGEPIVTTPANALNTFQRSGLDVLVMEKCLVTKGG